MKSHKISLTGRESGLVTGVKDVISFEAEEVVLDTEMGVLVIHGSDLRVTRLTVEKGEVDLSGNVDSLVYARSSLAEEKGGLFRRLFA